MQKMKVEPRELVFINAAEKAGDLKAKVDAANQELQDGIANAKFDKETLASAKKALKRGTALSKTLEKAAQA